MDAPSQPPADPGELARLVLRVRELKAHIEQLAATLPDRTSAPFLYRQLDDQLERLGDSVRALGNGSGEARETTQQRRSFLSRFLGKSEGPKVGQDDRFDLEGNAWTIPVSELIGFLSNSGKTGILSVDSSDERFVVEIQSGVLMRATSNRTPDGLRLGELLVEQGKLKARDVSRFVRLAREADMSLGEYLVSHAHVTERELRHALAVQAQGLFFRLISTEDCVYRYQDGVNLEGAKELGLNVTQLLLEGARRKDEARGSAIAARQLAAAQAQESKREQEDAA